MADLIGFFREFRQKNLKDKPNEDCAQYFRDEDQVICAVADGVTRYVPEGKGYPDLSHAHTVAEIFCSSAVYALRSGESMQSAFNTANRAIAKMNKNLGKTKKSIDYLEKDFFGCQGVAGVLTPGKLRYGYVADCGLIVYNKDFLPVFFSENNIENLERFREGWGFSSRAERRMFWAKTMRNCPHERHLTFGSLTGDPEAVSYLKIGELNLEPGDTVIFFSDGILPFVFERSFREVVRDHGDIGHCVDVLTKKLSAKHVSNLDDDKIFLAISIPESELIDFIGWGKIDREEEHKKS
jgi:hypothetical protein